jgi:hypothetical protein
VLADHRRITFWSSAGIYGYNLSGEADPGSVPPLIEHIHHTDAGGIIATQSIANAQDYHTAQPLSIAHHFRLYFLFRVFYSHFTPLSNKAFSLTN